MEGESSTFHGAGREDIDAKMLGTGRPFVVEIKTPKKRSIDLQVLEENMNKNAFGKVEVELEGVVNRKMVAHIKELPASKTYEARIKFDRSVEKDMLKGALEMLDGAEIKQETPTRVVHRRADKTRIRKVYSAKGELTSDLTANLEIHGEKGLYIKELVSGDSGRTNPNLTDLIGVEAVVETLDVISVVAEEGRFDVPEYILRRKDKKGLEE
jgi:tRNA pseudouridine synthase 10